MVIWEIVVQQDGITNAMKINILNTLNTAIDVHGTSKLHKIAEEVKDWLDTTYGKRWSVVIGDMGKVECAPVLMRTSV
jgi:hypothetical protein